MIFKALNLANKFLQDLDLKNLYNTTRVDILNQPEEDIYLRTFSTQKDIPYKIWTEIDIKPYKNIELKLVIKIYHRNNPEVLENKKNW